MEEFKDIILRIHAFEELLTGIDIMAGEIQRLSGSRMTTEEETRALGSFLDQLRLKAIEVEHSAAYLEAASPELCDRNREFETMIWILRNDLDLIAMRVCS